MKLHRITRWLVVLGAGALCACSSVRVTPSGEGVRYEPKPKGCGLEFLYKVPGRPYEEIADLEAHVTSPPAGGTLEALRDKACELGADAVIVTRNFVTNAYGHALVAGTAIKYVERAPPPPEEQPGGEQAPGGVRL
jgi:hypothetical protein